MAKRCGFPTLTFDFLGQTFLSIFISSFLELFVLEFWTGTGQTDKQTDRQTKYNNVNIGIAMAKMMSVISLFFYGV